MTDQPMPGNGRLARIESDIKYLRRDVDVVTHEIDQRLEKAETTMDARLAKIETSIDKRLEKIENILSRLAWILVSAVIIAVLASIGLG